ncbi:hypothetical protein LTR10_018193 [Elasticomyces elasticus]|uniref:Major facilitator superfamily (MFS) profile domain-containing protein n=1 Tax=Exophiala sideris TaxID=1016849 RepID=A0ABR0J2Y4_9EURO|nr:hypothetical protein LTR10_018193 [Elasticomyces elasticus]KAK5024926.1 hypothetical protein LTS07_008304 [Exophiala sideris]KAK5031485.1 hypothetical protein LTR13_007813 [Exophiala sideris]KAK5054965.1 hypothetical protein LTR69_008533 [Exophiala sideris]KAK5179845.1 hypothetical protein LTR44_007661 [Eurotiomycetes sp. CCFEE 6388]
MGHVRAKANTYNFAIAFFVALGSFTYGFNSAIIGSVIGEPSFYSYFKFEATSTYGGRILGASNGCYAGAGVVGCWTVFWLLDKLGRKRAVQVIALVCIISAALQTGAVHIAMFLVGRCLNGLGVGFINTAIPTYISEISPPAQRGRIVGSHGFIICVSYGVSAWCGLGIYYENNPAIQWRLLLALQIVAPLILLLGSPFIPESPRWLISAGRNEQGLKVLERLHANSSDPQHIGAREEYVQIKRQIELERSQPSPSIIQLVFSRKYGRRMLYGFYLQAMCQSTGVLVISNYMVLLLNKLGVTGSTPIMLLAVYNSWAACLNFVNALLIDRIGRIRIITIGISGCICCLILVTALNANFANAGNTNKSGQTAAIFFMFLFVTFYGFGIDVSSYVYCSEIFPTHIRAKGVGWSVSGLFLMTTIYTSIAGTAFNSIGWKYYLVFIIVTAGMLPYVVWKFPETKGLSLEEVGALFGDEVALDVTHLTDQEQQELDAAIVGGHALSGAEKYGVSPDAKIGHAWESPRDGSDHLEEVA